MAIEFNLPDLGENVESGDIIGLLVSEGDEIKADQAVLEVETGKAVVEVTCPHAGRIGKVLVKKGDKVPVGAAVLTIEPAAAPAKADKKPAPAAQKAPPTEKKPAAAPAAETKTKPQPAAKPVVRSQPASTPPPEQETVAQPAEVHRPQPSVVTEGQPNGDPAPAAPATRRLARELGIDLHDVAGSGPGGRITREDVMAAVRDLASRPSGGTGQRNRRSTDVDVEDEPAERDKWGGIRRQALSGMRRAIAANMARSHNTIPHVTNFDDADITELERIRKTGMSEVGRDVKLTTMAFLIKAVASSLRLHPEINVSSENLDDGEMIFRDYVSIGIAVDTERGLVVPALRNADKLTIPQIARDLMTLAERARGGQLSLDDMRGGTFTISNLGAVGGTYSTPIINWPEVAILLVGRSRTLPVYVGDRLEPRLLCPLSLSYDHRWVDGAVAARFLNEVKGYLEAPARLLLAP